MVRVQPSRSSKSHGAAIGPAASWGWWEGTPAAEAVVLALDTTSRIGGVALLRGAQVLGEETWLAGGNQTSQVLPAAVRLWERCGIAAADLSAAVVSTGPGSFTGLRVGASLGKGFSVALGIPLFGVPSLDVVAYQHRMVPATLCAVVDAGRGQRYVAWYRQTRGQLRRTGDYEVSSTEELAAALASTKDPTVVCGELSAEDVAILRARTDRTDRVGGAVTFASPAAGLRRPAYLAELGAWQLAQRVATDPAALQPLYLKRGGTL